MDETEKRALDASEGGKARAEKLTPEERKEIARKAAKARWAKKKADQQASARDENIQDSSVSGESEQASARDEPELLAGFSQADIVPKAESKGGLPKAVFWGSLDLMNKK